MVAVEAMKSGLDDYLLKAHDLFKRVPAAIRSALKRKEDRDQKLEAERKLKEAQESYRSLVDN